MTYEIMFEESEKRSPTRGPRLLPATRTVRQGRIQTYSGSTFTSKMFDNI
jgi:hypothetical protein